MSEQEEERREGPWLPRAHQVVTSALALEMLSRCARVTAEKRYAEQRWWDFNDIEAETKRFAERYVELQTKEHAYRAMYFSREALMYGRSLWDRGLESLRRDAVDLQKNAALLGIALPEFKKNNKHDIIAWIRAADKPLFDYVLAHSYRPWERPR